MAINFKCANCGHAISAPDEQAGKRSNCPRCGIMVFLPRAKAADEVPVELSAPGNDDDVIKLEADNRAFDLAMLADDDEQVISPGSAVAADELPAGKVETLILDWMAATVTGDAETAGKSLAPLTGRKKQVLPALDAVTVKVRSDKRLSDIPPPVLNQLKNKLLMALEAAGAKPKG